MVILAWYIFIITCLLVDFSASVDFKTPSSFTVSRDAEKIFIESQDTETKDGIPKTLVSINTCY